jgi:hypothetical protein
MKTREIQSTLLTHYLNAIQRISLEDDMKIILGIVDELFISNGICHCSLHVFKCSIYGDCWVEKYAVRGSYWGKVPFDARMKEEVVDRLMIRVNNLQKELALN